MCSIYNTYKYYITVHKLDICAQINCTRGVLEMGSRYAQGGIK